MSFILTFLGKGGTGRTTLAIAAAKAYAAQGQRVLLLGQDVEPSLSLLLEETGLSHTPQDIAPNLAVAALSTAQLLEQSWGEVKQLEAQYLRTPFFKSVFGQELGILPGMDSALSLYALKGFDASDRYDIIIYDNLNSASTLRMFSMPEILNWYMRRFRQVFADSDLGKAISPFIQPVAATVLNNADWSGQNFSQPFSMADNELVQGQTAVADPRRVAACLVSTEDAIALKSAQLLWGGAQQANLTVASLLLNQSAASNALEDQFRPLPVHGLPRIQDGQWQPLIDAMPKIQQDALAAPKPMTVDEVQRQVRLFLPGFDKAQVQLTQYGPELTIAAGDQRRNLFLPPSLKGQKVTGAKFQEGYLLISF